MLVDDDVKMRISGLSFAYDGGKRVLSDFTFDFLSGGKYVIIGGNGAGKTTLFKCIIGRLKPQKGTIEIFAGNGGNGSALMRRRDVGIAYCGQEKAGGTFPVSVREVLNIGAFQKTKSGLRISKCGDASKVFDCRNLKCFKSLEKWAAGVAERDFYGLSGGEKQKVSLLRCLMQCPEIMLLDEPSSFLDAGAQDDIRIILEELADTAVTVLVASHDLELNDRLFGLGWRKVALESADGGRYGFPDA